MLEVPVRQRFELEHAGVAAVSVVQVRGYVDGGSGWLVVGEGVGGCASFVLQLTTSMKHANNDLVHSMHEGFVSVVTLLKTSSYINVGCTHLREGLGGDAV